MSNNVQVRFTRQAFGIPAGTVRNIAKQDLIKLVDSGVVELWSDEEQEAAEAAKRAEIEKAKKEADKAIEEAMKKAQAAKKDAAKKSANREHTATQTRAGE